MVKLVTKKMPAWQEILLLNYRERLETAATELEVAEALNMALEDTARDVAGRTDIWDMALPDYGIALARQLLRRRRQC